jgi:integrase
LPESYLFPARPRSDSAGCYSTRSYCRHVARACAKAGLPHWSPYPLRHTRATEIGEDQGTEAAQRGLGHKHLSTTEKYAKKRMGQKLKIMLAS